MSLTGDQRPRDARTGVPLKPRRQPGYYPGFSTLGQQKNWDAATRNTVVNRVREVPPIRFFTAEEVDLMHLLVAHLLPQDDRDPGTRIPIVPFIDQRLHEGRIAGYRFEKMPPDGEAYRLGFCAIEAMSAHRHQRAFGVLSWSEQDRLLKSIHDAEPYGGADEIWQRMEVHRWWALVVQDCVEVYYAHPWAWDEIGFGGPAYPRAYFRLEGGEPESWEVAEQRYEWKAPPDAVSDPAGADIAAHAEHPPHGQGGTH